MNLLTDCGLDYDVFTPYLNTGTLFDLSAGAAIGSYNGKHIILNGGVGRLTGLSGRQERHKSTLAFSFAMRAAYRYPHTNVWTHDSESSVPGKSRLIAVAGNEAIPPEMVSLSDETIHDITSFFTAVRRLAAYKQQNRKKLEVETPFIDPLSGKPLRMLIPTIIVIDSLSKLGCAELDATFDKNELGSSKNYTIFMKDANLKTQMLRQFPVIASKSGIYFVITAHINNKIEPDAYNQTPKDLHNMKGNDKIKNVGSGFGFLMSILLESRKIDNLVNSSKTNCLYPLKGVSSTNELNRVTTYLTRCKNNMSGNSTPFVVSKTQGVLPGVSNYDYLRSNNLFGLTGSSRSQQCEWLPEHTLTYDSVRQLTNENYELHRALEVLAQLCYVKNEWTTTKWDIDTKVGPATFVNGVLKNDGLVNAILNSRGHWTYDKEEKREYMSIFDILSLLQGKSVLKAK